MSLEQESLSDTLHSTFYFRSTARSKKGKWEFQRKWRTCFDKLLVCSRCEICLQAFSPPCNVMCARLRDSRRRSGAHWMEDLLVLALLLSAELRFLPNQPAQTHLNKLAVHPRGYTAKPYRTLFIKVQKQWLHRSVGSFSVLGKYWLWGWGGWAHSRPISP